MLDSIRKHMSSKAPFPHVEMLFKSRDLLGPLQSTTVGHLVLVARLPVPHWQLPQPHMDYTLKRYLDLLAAHSAACTRFHRDVEAKVVWGVSEGGAGPARQSPIDCRWHNVPTDSRLYAIHCHSVGIKPHEPPSL